MATEEATTTEIDEGEAVEARAKMVMVEMHGPVQEDGPQARALRGVPVRVGTRAAERDARLGGAAAHGGGPERVEGTARGSARGGRKGSAALRQGRPGRKSARGRGNVGGEAQEWDGLDWDNLSPQKSKLGKRDGCTASREARIFVTVPES